MKRNCFKYAGGLLLAVLFFMMPKGKNLPDLEMGLKAGAGKTKNECQLVFATNTDPAQCQDFSFRYINRCPVQE